MLFLTLLFYTVATITFFILDLLQAFLRSGQFVLLKKSQVKMRAFFQLNVVISKILQTSQDVQDLDFGDSLDIFQDCSIYLI